MLKGMHRRTFMKGTAWVLNATILSSITGCFRHFTQDLYSDVPSYVYDTETETVDQLYITGDKKNFVILGEKYHYIVPVDPELGKAITSDLHPRMQAEFEPIYVDDNQQINGTLLLRISDIDKLDHSQVSEAKALGFYLRSSENTMVSYFSFTGHRYNTTIDLTAQRPTKLNKTYTLEVHVHHQKNKVVQVLMTPITVAADGVSMIISIPLIPFVFAAAAPFRK